MRICFITKGFQEEKSRLQPWSYLLTIAEDLKVLGHEVILLTDGGNVFSEEAEFHGFRTLRVKRLGKFGFFLNQGTLEILKREICPDLVFLHLGLTSFIYPDFIKKIPYPIIGVFTSPIYKREELFRLGLKTLVAGYQMTLSHLIGLLVSSNMLKKPIINGWVDQIIVESETTLHRLTGKGIPIANLRLIRPVIPKTWFHPAVSEIDRAVIRQGIGYSQKDIIVCFFGPPPPLRGLPSLIKAVSLARDKNPLIRLLVLSRERSGEYEKDHRAVEDLILELDGSDWVRNIPGFLSKAELTKYVVSSDIVCLPFELVPSDMPLSILEALALGIPVITTKVACLDEMVPEGKGICLPHGDISALSGALVELSSSLELRTTIGKAGNQHVFEWDKQRECDTTLIDILSVYTER